MRNFCELFVIFFYTKTLIINKNMGNKKNYPLPTYPPIFTGMKKILLLTLVLLTAQQLFAQDECGVWRWEQKLLIDRSRINWSELQPESATITELRNLKGPNEYRHTSIEDAQMVRQDAERRLVKMTCYVYDVKVNEKDMEYRLLLSTHKDGTGDKMSAEIPNPRCTSLNRFPYLKRKYADARYVADDIKSWNDAGYVVKVDLVGAPFWNMPRNTESFAPNGMEIHPVLYLKAYLPKTRGFKRN